MALLALARLASADPCPAFQQSSYPVDTPPRTRPTALPPSSAGLPMRCARSRRKPGPPLAGPFGPCSESPAPHVLCTEYHSADYYPPDWVRAHALP